MFVAVYFDPEGERKVRELWRISYDQGFDHKLQTLGIKPHLTLAAWDVVDVGAMTDRLRRLAAEHRQFTLTFDTIASFVVGEPALVLVPQASRRLLDLHAAVHASAPEHSGSWSHYTPDHWMPHCTVAINIDHDRLGAALTTLRGSIAPFSVTVTEITLADAYPVDTKALFALAGA